VTAPMRMSVCRPSVGKYVGGSSETGRGSGDRGRSLGLVCAVGRGGTWTLCDDKPSRKEVNG
jgi:hypothetical protein